MGPAKSQHDRTRYQGKNRAYLILAICIPVGLLYLRLVLGLAATEARVEPQQAGRLNQLSTVVLYVFYGAQCICAWYVQQKTTRPGPLVKRAAAYVTVLLVCVFCSITGAVMLEAFGLNVFLRLAGVR
jgi:hypothetical protein